MSLQQFSVDLAEKASNVCLAHLFTYQDFDEGTLGLAYVAPSKLDIAGGLCSKGRVLLHHCPTLVIIILNISSGVVNKSVCCFYSTACSSSTNEQRAIYLNTGLTSTKNYGKTILTKVGWFSGSW